VIRSLWKTGVYTTTHWPHSNGNSDRKRRLQQTEEKCHHSQVKEDMKDTHLVPIMETVNDICKIKKIKPVSY
jgi:hypothetical protein